MARVAAATEEEVVGGRPAAAAEVGTVVASAAAVLMAMALMVVVMVATMMVMVMVVAMVVLVAWPPSGRWTTSALGMLSGFRSWQRSCSASRQGRKCQLSCSLCTCNCAHSSSRHMPRSSLHPTYCY